MDRKLVYSRLMFYKNIGETQYKYIWSFQYLNGKLFCDIKDSIYSPSSGNSERTRAEFNENDSWILQYLFVQRGKNNAWTTLSELIDLTGKQQTTIQKKTLPYLRNSMAISSRVKGGPGIVIGIEFNKEHEGYMLSIPEDYKTSFELYTGDETGESDNDTILNARNLWKASQKQFNEMMKNDRRFSNLNICDGIMPRVKHKRKEKEAVWTPVVKDNEVTEPISEAIKKISEKEHIMLVGEGGIGKTTTLISLMQEAFKDERKGTYTRKYESAKQVPLFIELSGAPDTYGMLYKDGESSYIRRAIYRTFTGLRQLKKVKQISNNDVEQIDEIFTMDPETAVIPVEDLLKKVRPAPEFLLLLDGFNECSRAVISKANNMTVADMVRSEIESLMSSYPNVRIILTGRSDIEFDNIKDTKVHKLPLTGMSDEAVEKYLTDKGGIDTARISQIKSNEKLWNILRIPLFLTMYADALTDDETDHNTRGSILRDFISSRKQNVRWYTVKDRLSDVTENIAGAATAKNITRFTQKMQYYMLDFVLPQIAWTMSQNDCFDLSVIQLEKLMREVIIAPGKVAGKTTICGKYGIGTFKEYTSRSSRTTHVRSMSETILNNCSGYRVDLNSDDEVIDAAMESVTEVIADCCIHTLGLLSEDSDGDIRFIHQHFRDYFAAQYVINKLKIALYAYEEAEDKETAVKCISEIFGGAPLSEDIIRFIGEYLDEDKNAPVPPTEPDGNWTYNVPAEKCDRSIIDRVLNILRDEDMCPGMPIEDMKECDDDYVVWNICETYSVYNVVEILKQVRGDLSGVNFSSIDLRGCLLNGFHLDRKGIPAIFDNAVLTYVSLGIFPYDRKSGFTKGIYLDEVEHRLYLNRNGVFTICDMDTLSFIGVWKCPNNHLVTESNGQYIYAYFECRRFTNINNVRIGIYDRSSLNKINEIVLNANDLGITEDKNVRIKLESVECFNESDYLIITISRHSRRIENNESIELHEDDKWLEEDTYYYSVTDNKIMREIPVMQNENVIKKHQIDLTKGGSEEEYELTVSIYDYSQKTKWIWPIEHPTVYKADAENSKIICSRHIGLFIPYSRTLECNENDLLVCYTPYYNGFQVIDRKKRKIVCNRQFDHGIWHIVGDNRGQYIAIELGNGEVDLYDTKKNIITKLCNTRETMKYFGGISAIFHPNKDEVLISVYPLTDGTWTPKQYCVSTAFTVDLLTKQQCVLMKESYLQVFDRRESNILAFNYTCEGDIVALLAHNQNKDVHTFENEHPFSEVLKAFSLVILEKIGNLWRITEEYIIDDKDTNNMLYSDGSGTLLLLSTKLRKMISNMGAFMAKSKDKVIVNTRVDVEITNIRFASNGNIARIATHDSVLEYSLKTLECLCKWEYCPSYNPFFTPWSDFHDKDVLPDTPPQSGVHLDGVDITRTRMAFSSQVKSIIACYGGII